MPYADFDCRVTIVGGSLRDGLRQLKASFSRHRPPDDVRLVIMGRLDSVTLGVPAAEVTVEAGSSCLFDAEMPLAEAIAMEWHEVPAKKLMHLGFRDGAVYSNKIMADHPEIRIGRVSSAPAIDARPTDALFDGAEHLIESPIDDPRGEPLGLAYLRCLQLRRGNGLTQLAQHEIAKAGDEKMRRGINALEPLGFEMKDLEWVIEKRYGKQLLPKGGD